MTNDTYKIVYQEPDSANVVETHPDGLWVRCGRSEGVTFSSENVSDLAKALMAHASLGADQCWRDGYAAGLEAAAEMVGGFLVTKTSLPVDKVVDCEEHIRALDIPEEPFDE